MARAYSLDLRERVVGAAASGQSCRSVAKTFMISVASVVKWSQRQRAVGSPAARKWAAAGLTLWRARGNGFFADRREAGSHAAALLAELAERGLVVELLCAVAFSPARRRDVQKKACTPPNRIGRTSPGGASGGRRVRRIDPPAAGLHRQDLGQNQHDAHPWPMRRGQRLVAKAPLRPMADADVSGGAALRPGSPRPASSTGRSTAQASAPMSSSSRAHPHARRHRRHGQSRQPQGPRRSRRHPRRQSQALLPAPPTRQTSIRSSRPSPK